MVVAWLFPKTIRSWVWSYWRYADEATMEVVEMVLGGSVNMLI